MIDYIYIYFRLWLRAARRKFYTTHKERLYGAISNADWSRHCFMVSQRATVAERQASLYWDQIQNLTKRMIMLEEDLQVYPNQLWSAKKEIARLTALLHKADIDKQKEM